MTTQSLTPHTEPAAAGSPAAGNPFADSWPRGPGLRLWQRTMLIGAGLVLVSLLVTAARLPPNPLGMGTHQGLGLPPCSFVMWFGKRCPACGMTTSWAHLMRGQLLQAAHSNTGGLMLGLYALVLGPWMIVSAVRGRWWIGPLDPQWILLGGGLVFLVTTAQWCWRVFV